MATFSAQIQFADGNVEFAPNLADVNMEWLHEAIPGKSVYFQREDGGGVIFAGRRIVRIDVSREIELDREEPRRAVNR